MSFPVPVAYNITNDHNTEVVYGNGDTLDLIRTMVDIPADLVLKYEEFTPDHDITSAEPMVLKLLPYASTTIIMPLDDITPMPGLDIVFLVWLGLWNREGSLIHIRATRVVGGDGSVNAKTILAFTEATCTITIPTSANTIFQANKKYALIQLKMGYIEET